MQFYTYIYRDPSRQHEPIYIGKGHAKRAWYHLNRSGKHPFIQRLQYMKKNNIEPSIEIINALDESHAFLLEMSLIEIIGRKDLGKGTLLNLTDGGDGVSNPAESSRMKIGAANKDRKRTPEQIKVNSEYRKGKPNGRKGLRYTQKKKDIPHGNVDKVRSQEFKDNLSSMYKGITAWNKGIPSRRISCICCRREFDPGNFSKHKICKNKEE